MFYSNKEEAPYEDLHASVISFVVRIWVLLVHCNIQAQLYLKKTFPSLCQKKVFY